MTATWAESFNEQYEQARSDIAFDRAVRRRSAARRSADNPPTMEDLPHIERARDTREAIALRLEYGADHPGGPVACDSIDGEPGWYVEPFHWDGLCSTSSAILRLFVTKTDKGQKLTAGRCRSRMDSGSPKILGLDREFVGLNERMRGAVTVKLRREFQSFEDFDDAIRGCGVQLPNLVTWGGDGVTVERPDLIWLLEASVNFGPNGRSRPMRALRKARQHLVRKLAALGAVVESEASALIVKNPLCQMLSNAIMTPEPYQLGPTDADHRREQIRVDDGQDNVVVLNDARDLFEALRWRAYKEVIQFFPVGDLDGFGRRVRDIAEELAGRGCIDLSAARSTAARVTGWTWAKHDPNKVAGRRRPGPCADLVQGVASIRERQAIGGRWAAGQRRDKNVRKLAKAYIRLVRAFGGAAEPSHALLAREAGLSARTVDRRWDEVVAMAAFANDRQSAGILLSPIGSDGTSFGSRQNILPPATNLIWPTGLTGFHPRKRPADNPMPTTPGPTVPTFRSAAVAA